jgi:hypothetical protein
VDVSMSLSMSTSDMSSSRFLAHIREEWFLFGLTFGLTFGNFWKLLGTLSGWRRAEGAGSVDVGGALCGTRDLHANKKRGYQMRRVGIYRQAKCSLNQAKVPWIRPNVPWIRPNIRWIRPNVRWIRQNFPWIRPNVPSSKNPLLLIVLRHQECLDNLQKKWGKEPPVCIAFRLGSCWNAGSQCEEPSLMEGVAGVIEGVAGLMEGEVGLMEGEA